MAVFRCKMCGGDLEVQEGATSCVCEFCGTRQTLPSNQDENLQGLFNRANVLRIKSEFDKASDIYEKILQADETEAEAYWGLILCKYGIEYVEDPATYKRIPTCHRASYDAVTTDEDYKNALKYADAIQREIYESEAAKIDEIQKGILTIAQKESPYDVFICYKETDESGNRTQDSVIANEIYYQLTHEGFKVFYAAISLEDKLGSEYEPVIFSALNTAKVMLVLGTKPEYFNAVWVKNEWSRFLKIMKKDRTRLMIPCYKDMDPYELPEEFAHLQAQNMGKIGFINDIVRGIQKVVGKNQPQPAISTMRSVTTTPYQTNNVSALLKRGYMALEDSEWEKADNFFEDVLNQDPECAEAYWGKYLAANHQPNELEMKKALVASLPEAKKETLIAFPLDHAHEDMIVQSCVIPGLFSENTIRNRYNFNNRYRSEVQERIKQKEAVIASLEADKLIIRVRQYAKGEDITRYESWRQSVESALDDYVLEAQKADQMQIEELWNAYVVFVRKTDNDIRNEWKEVSIKREQEYQKYVTELNSAKSKLDFVDAERNFSREHMRGYKAADIFAAQCRDTINKLEEESAQKELQVAKRKKTIIILIVAVSIIVIIGWILLKTVILPQQRYNDASRLINEERYSEAISILEKQQGYKDSTEKIAQCETAIMELNYAAADKLMSEGKYDEAINAFSKLGAYKDSLDKIIECQQAINVQTYNLAETLLNNGNYLESIKLFASLDGYKDSEDRYSQAVKGQASVLSRLSTQEISDFLSGISNKISSDIISEMDVLPVFLLNAPKLKVGDIVKFGHYEQDNDISNGQEAIEWIILEKEKNKII